jgi:hypothetical protein
LVIAITMPMSTKTTMAACVQIQVEGIRSASVPRRLRRRRHYPRPMQRSRFIATAAAVAALLAWCAGAQAARSRAARPLFASHPVLGGINVPPVHATTNMAEADRAVALAAQLHAGVIRTDFPWSAMEPRPGELDPHALAYADRLLADAAAAHIGVMATVQSSPCWASAAPAHLLAACTPGGSGPADAYPPRDPATYGAFLAKLAARYGSRLAGVEIWNEPDQSNENYLAGTEKVRHYTELVKAAYPAVKRADPAVRVLAGSFVGADGRFLDALYAAGMKGYYDGLSVHFYTLTVASLRAIHENQLAHGDQAPLWLDEFGWSSCWPRERVEQEQACVTPRVQAANLYSTFREFALMPYVAAAVVYKLQDSPGEDFGVLDAVGAHKPSFASLASVLRHPAAGPPPITLRLYRRRGAVVATGSGPVGDFMVLEALRGAVPRYRAFFTMDRFNHFTLTVPRVLGARGLTVRVYQYGIGVAGATQRRI